MSVSLAYVPALVAMLVLMALSAFFSCSEAAFFSLSQSDRAALKDKGRLARSALRLLESPERLLNSILLGNLVVNLLTFTLSTILSIRLQRDGRTDLAGLMAAGSLLCVILFCEVLPKNLGVAAPKRFVSLATLPISLLVRFLQPVLPVLQMTNILSRRLFCPNFSAEPHLRVGDLERAVEMCGDDATLLKREQRVLQSIVSLSDFHAEELMRPRSMIRVFRPPISFAQIMEQLQGKLPKSGYCLLTEEDSDEVAAALCLTRLSASALGGNLDGKSGDNPENLFEPIIYVPWSSSAEAFDRLRQENLDVAVVVNEFGETMGILTLDDIIETVFTREQGRSRRLLNRMELKRIDRNRWQVNGLTSLRRLQRKFDADFSEYSSLTVGGLIREILERLPRINDRCKVGPLEFRVFDASEENDLVIQMTVEEPRN